VPSTNRYASASLRNGFLIAASILFESSPQIR
jgi:hypothetical protein